MRTFLPDGGTVSKVPLNYRGMYPSFLHEANVLLIVVRRGIEPLYRELPDIHDLPSDSNRPCTKPDYFEDEKPSVLCGVPPSANTLSLLFNHP